MESDDDTFILPPLEETVPPPKLKRLRRASNPVVDSIAPASPPTKTLKVEDLLKAGEEFEEEVPVTVTSPPLGPDSLDAGRMAAEGEDMLATAASPSPGSDIVDAGGKMADDGINLSFGGPDQFACDDTSNLARGIDDKGVDDDIALKGEELDWSREIADGSQKKKSAKKRLNLDSDDGDYEDNKSAQKKKKKVRSDKPEDNDDRPAQSKRTLEKERKAHLVQLHAESQRLLRETRNASFKPVPVAQRPISSVLEKIRLRKLEVSRKSANPSSIDSLSHASDLQKESAELFDKTNVVSGSAEDSKTLEVFYYDQDRNSGKGDHITVSTTCLDGNEHQDMRDPMSKNSAAGMDSQDKDVGISSVFPDGNEQEETIIQRQSYSGKLAPSLLATDSNSDSDIPDNISSDEEDDDKENIDPLEEKAVHLDLFIDNLVKSIVDDEAEEEDDSDHDLMRFPEDEEENESEEQEELNDLIATSFEENHVDHEKRNQLHQKWLEQKDAEETENFLQRLEHHKKREHTVNDEHTEESEEESEKDVLDEDTVQENSVRDITRKAKQKIALMFTEKDDEFVSSDDEETELRLSRQRLLEKTEEHVSILPPEEDGNSCQVFNLIRKLNIAPDPKKRIKPTRSSFEASLLGGSGNSSSKSFLGRMSANSMPAPCRPSSGCFKSFVFGRDDSNSRSVISLSSSESLLEVNRAETQSCSSTRAKATSKYSTSKTNNTAELKTGGPSLFEILRRSSIQFDQQLQNASETSGKTFSATQTAYQLQAFRVNKVVKKLPQES